MTIYKAYDIRGIYPKELNEGLAYKIGKAFVSEYNLKQICVGKDIRLSSDKIHAALIKGITEQGCDVIDIGLANTPSFYFAVPFYSYEFGIIITASHNPKEYNGFKIIDFRNKKHVVTVGYENGLNRIEQIINSDTIPKYSGNTGKITEKNISEDYIKHILKFAPKEKLKKIKIVADASNGTGVLYVKEVFNSMGVQLVPLSFEMNGNFPDHGPNPTLKDALKKLQKEVKKQKASFGVAFDADADRAIFIDDKGEKLDPGFVLVLLANALVKTEKDIVIYDLTNSWVVKEEISKIAVPVVSKVGQITIKNKMIESNAVLAGEVSGHYTFRDNYYGDSGIISAVLMAKILGSSTKKLSALVKPFKRYFKPDVLNYDVKDKDKAIEKIKEHYKDAKKLLFIDGITVEYEDWWFNVRPSNTEPLIRVNIEAKTNSLLKKKIKEIEKLIK